MRFLSLFAAAGSLAAQTLTLAPAADPIRAGSSTTVTATCSLSSPAITWSVASGAARLSAATGSPVTVTLPVQGGAVVRAICTDGSGGRVVSTREVGSVASDANGFVTAQPSSVAAILLPMLRQGLGPWSLQNAKVASDGATYAANLTSAWVTPWETVQAGTLSLTAGSATVTGTGTAFQALFACNGTDWIIPLDGTARRPFRVASCSSQTSMTISPGVYGWTGSTKSGVPFGKMTAGESDIWAASANYYDVVAAFYALYWQTGKASHLTHARTLADRWYQSPWFDSGTNCRPDQGFWCLPPRSQALLGLMLRAIDGRPEIWPAIAQVMDFWRVTEGAPTYMRDPREDGYRLMFFAVAAVYDTDATRRANWATAAATWRDFFSARQVVAGRKNWLMTPSVTNSYYGLGTAAVTNGSSTVTVGAGGLTAGVFQWTDNVTTKQRRVRFFAGASTSVESSTLDAVDYVATYASATTFTLDRAYEGTTRSGIAYNLDAVTGGFSQPFISGILARAFYYEWLRSGSTVAKQMAIDAGDYVAGAGYWPETKGLRYLTDASPCEPQLTTRNPPCNYQGLPNSNEDAETARVLSAEGSFAVWLAYHLEPNSTRLANIAKIAGPAWSGLEEVGPDVDTTNMTNTWAYFASVQLTNGKWPGMLWGIGATYGAAAVRAGTITAPALATYTVTYSLPAGTDGAAVDVMRPSGEIVSTTCSASPCSTTYDSTQAGLFRFRLRYTASGVTRFEGVYP